MNEPQSWKPELYDQKLSYISEYGKQVIHLLQPRQGEYILDLGCGTGDLAYEIAAAGAQVTGVDLSAAMIEQAIVKYPQQHFMVSNAERLNMTDTFDAVFSNAALHWMKHPELVVEGVWHALKSHGRFVAEFGGIGNCESIIQAIAEVIDHDYGLIGAELNPWYFPSIGQYSSLLEQQGFHVTYAIHFDRLTKLADGEQGLSHWLSAFANPFFTSIPENEIPSVYDKISDKVRTRLFHDGDWYADYKRIRVIAIKQ